MKQAPRFSYRPEIDGLRAVAVVPVVLYHAGFEFFGGGYIGVDVFFVISGYLITSIIFAEVVERKFSIIRFYQRRARRILPALFLVTFCSIPFAWYWMPPLEHKDFAQSVAAVSLFASNFLFWQESGYFEADAELKPLLHTWSLAVEEQYYVIFPFFMYFAYKFGFKALCGTLFALALLSFGLSEWGARHTPSATFFLIHTRAWELFLGSLCALLLARVRLRESQFLSLLGVGAIAVPVFLYDEQVPFPSAYALAPTLGTAAVILFAGKETIVWKLLSLRGCVGVGLISYSVYLWHQPILAFARIRSTAPLGMEQTLGLLLLSFLLAYLSWRLVELPFRRMAVGPSLLPVSATVSAAFVAFGLFVHLQSGLPSRFPPEVQNYFAAKLDRNPFQEKCFHGPERPLPSSPSDDCIVGPDGLRLFVIGDSHASALAYAIRQRAKEADFGFVEHTYSGCPALPSLYRVGQEGYRRCHEFMSHVLDLAREDDAVVLLASRWTYYVRGNGFNNKEGGIERADLGAVDVIERRGEETREKRVLRAYRERLRELLEDTPVILIYPIPEAGWDVPYFAGRMHLNGRDTSIITTSLQRYMERNGPVLETFDSLLHPNLYKVKPHEYLCDTFARERCAVVAKGMTLYFDENHLTTAGANLIAPAIIEHLETIAAKPTSETTRAEAAAPDMAQSAKRGAARSPER